MLIYNKLMPLDFLKINKQMADGQRIGHNYSVTVGYAPVHCGANF